MLNELQDSHVRERDFAIAEALRLATVRDDLNIRYLFGLATFNAASIVALLTALGTSDGLLAFGLDPGSLRAAMVLFAVGVVMAAVAIIATHNNLTVRAGATSARVTTLNTLISVSASDRADDGAYESLSTSRDNLFSESLKYSNTAIICQGLSGGAWLAGALTPLLKLMGISEMVSLWL